MKYLLSTMAALFLIAPLSAQTTTLTASNLKDNLNNQPLTGLVCLIPELNGVPTAFTDGGSQYLPNPTCFQVTNGVLFPNSTVPNTADANPAICYQVVAELANGTPIYTYPQPMCATGARSPSTPGLRAAAHRPHPPAREPRPR